MKTFLFCFDLFVWISVLILPPNLFYALFFSPDTLRCIFKQRKTQYGTASLYIILCNNMIFFTVVCIEKRQKTDKEGSFDVKNGNPILRGLNLCSFSEVSGDSLSIYFWMKSVPSSSECYRLNVFTMLSSCLLDKLIMWFLKS